MTTLPRTPSFPARRQGARSSPVPRPASWLGAAAALAEAGAEVTLVARRAAGPGSGGGCHHRRGRQSHRPAARHHRSGGHRRRLSAHGPFDVLVNSAGLARHAPALDTTAADYDAVMDVNLRAAYFLTPRRGAGPDHGGPDRQP